jgi:hypothetical protein
MMMMLSLAHATVAALMMMAFPVVWADEGFGLTGYDGDNVIDFEGADGSYDGSYGSNDGGRAGTASPVDDESSGRLALIVGGCVALGVVLICVAGAFYCVRRRRIQREHAMVSPTAVLVPSGSAAGNSAKRSSSSKAAKNDKKRPAIPETALERRRREGNAVTTTSPYGEGQPSPHSQYAVPPLLQPSNVYASGPYAGAELSPQRPLVVQPYAQSPAAGLAAVHPRYSSTEYHHSPHDPLGHPPLQYHPSSCSWVSYHTGTTHASSFPLPLGEPSFVEGGYYPFGIHEQRTSGHPQASGNNSSSTTPSASSSAPVDVSPTIPLHSMSARKKHPASFQIAADDDDVAKDDNARQFNMNHPHRTPPPPPPVPQPSTMRRDTMPMQEGLAAAHHVSSPFQENDDTATTADDRGWSGSTTEKCGSQSTSFPEPLAQTAYHHHG